MKRKEILDISRESHWSGLEETCNEMGAGLGRSIAIRKEKIAYGVYEQDLSIRLVCKETTSRLVEKLHLPRGAMKYHVHFERIKYELAMYYGGEKLAHIPLGKSQAYELFKMADTRTKEQVLKSLKTGQAYLPFEVDE